jgi:hypothetical protein
MFSSKPSSKIIVLYRIIALLILSLPTIINIYIKGDIVSSLIYAPLITLLLSAIAIFIDEKIESILNKAINLEELKSPSVNPQPTATNDDSEIKMSGTSYQANFITR